MYSKKIQNANFFQSLFFGKTINRNFLFIWSIKKHYFMDIKVLHIDSNHSVLWDQLCLICESQRFYIFKEEIEAKINGYQGIVIESF
jgi:hypothetical protein